MRCAYMIFSKEASINATTRQVSVKDFFSRLTLKSVGTTDFSLVLGIWDIPKGGSGSVDLTILSPNGQRSTGKWSTKESKDETHVHNVIFSLNKLPLTTEGNYTFIIANQDGTEISRRLLKVSFSESEEGAYE